MYPKMLPTPHASFQWMFSGVIEEHDAWDVFMFMARPKFATQLPSLILHVDVAIFTTVATDQ